MGDKTRIDWTDATLNPATGCTRVSPACDHCYIEHSPPFRIAGRRFTITCDRCAGTGSTTQHQGTCTSCGGEGAVPGDGPGSTTGVELHPERLDQPLRWQRPRMVFVGSLTDMFHEQVPDELLADLFAVMRLTPQHTYQLLTKRPARMRSLLTSDRFLALVTARLHDRWDPASAGGLRDRVGWVWDLTGKLPAPWPLPNVWLGVTVENQQWADTRIPILEATPATVRFLSAEPLLGRVDLTPCRCSGGCPLGCARHDPGSLTDTQLNSRSVHVPGIDWVIVGGESGTRARPTHPDWARRLVGQCVDMDIPVFFKQWGQWAPAPTTVDRLPGETPTEHHARSAAVTATHTITPEGHLHPIHPAGDTNQPVGMRRYGSKAAAGYLVDGIAYRQYPAVRTS